MISPIWFAGHVGVAAVTGHGACVYVERARVRRVGRSGASCEVVTLVDGDDEERVRLVDAVGVEPLEERVERRVVVGELLLVAGLARAGRLRERVVVVRVRDVRERHGDAVLLHLRDLAEGVLREGTVEARETALVRRVGDVASRRSP